MPQVQPRAACLNRNAEPLSRANTVPLRGKMWRPGTKMHMVTDLSAAQTGTSTDQDGGGLLPERNGDGVPLIEPQTPDRPELGAREPRLFSTGRTVDRYGAGAQEGSVSAAETQDDGESNSIDVAEM